MLLPVFIFLSHLSALLFSIKCGLPFTAYSKAAHLIRAKYIEWLKLNQNHVEQINIIRKRRHTDTKKRARLKKNENQCTLHSVNTHTHLVANLQGNAGTNAAYCLHWKLITHKLRESFRCWAVSLSKFTSSSLTSTTTTTTATHAFPFKILHTIFVYIVYFCRFSHFFCIVAVSTVFDKYACACESE